MARGTLHDGAFIKHMPSPFSKTQVIQWLEAIQFYDAKSNLKDERGRDKDSERELPPATLENLTILTRLHLVAFPFEATPIHYSRSHCMDVSPEGLFQRLVVQRAGGSYCYGLNGLLFGMLRGLGYRAYAGQARCNGNSSPEGPPEYLQTTHMVIFVQPFPESNLTYIVDDGFGGGGLTRPILLSDDEDNIVIGTTSSEKQRLRKASLPQASLEDPAWTFEVKHEKPGQNPSNAPWKVVYSFSETEYFQCDFEAMSYFVSTHPPYPDSPFSTLRDVMILKKYFWIDDKVDVEKRDIGTFTFYDKTLRKHVGQDKEDRTVSTEEERIALIKDIFNIQIDTDAIENIRGRKVALG
ncbi:cysteine proteinase [Dendrothele bispora CBS 962.96]|uniref:Cysteine proteinase n=1 Tax=Dendrothele bispora (strain CBS 962.96) TaxID=1314807 RepID=A0A4S8M0D9_DENBC|nr:cysteine proteinase [Dendrothele bispora CBS 962.96]